MTALEQASLDEAVRIIRLIREVLITESNGVPRYTVTPGAALNSVVEEDIDPFLRRMP